MNQVRFRFYEELNNYLPEELHKRWFESSAEPGTTVGKMISSFGIPLDEVDLILVNQQSESFDYLLQEKDRISVYPIFETLDISSVTALRQKPLREPAFICDVHLGRLSKYLRMLGFDTLYSNQYTPEQLVVAANSEQRIILSRSKQLTKDKRVTRVYWIRSSEPLEQLKDLINKLDLSKLADPLTRCLNCNNGLTSVDKQDVIHQIEARTTKYYSEFFRCHICDQIYWKGSHYQHMKEFINQIAK
jgi:uncharacterized protein with PIN domain